MQAARGRSGSRGSGQCGDERGRTPSTRVTWARDQNPYYRGAPSCPLQNHGPGLQESWLLTCWDICHLPTIRDLHNLPPLWSMALILKPGEARLTHKDPKKQGCGAKQITMVNCHSWNHQGWEVGRIQVSTDVGDSSNGWVEQVVKSSGLGGPRGESKIKRGTDLKHQLHGGP